MNSQIRYTSRFRLHHNSETIFLKNLTDYGYRQQLGVAALLVKDFKFLNNTMSDSIQKDFFLQFIIIQLLLLLYNYLITFVTATICDCYLCYREYRLFTLSSVPFDPVACISCLHYNNRINIQRQPMQPCLPTTMTRIVLIQPAKLQNSLYFFNTPHT